VLEGFGGEGGLGREMGWDGVEGVGSVGVWCYRRVKRRGEGTFVARLDLRHLDDPRVVSQWVGRVDTRAR
jgi:hypothetical protein